MDEIKKIAKRLKQKVGEGQPDLVESEEELALGSPKLLPDSYRRAERLKKVLLEEYKDTDVEDATECRIASNEYGEVYHRKESVQMEFRTPECRREDLLSDLKLLYGIGPTRERKLKNRGYKTVEDLTKHRKWREKAGEFLETFEENPSKALTHFHRWKPASHPSVLNLSSRFREKDFALLDIETMGLTNQPVILIGVALPGKNSTELHQLLLKDVHQEVAAMSGFMEKLQGREAVITFNGKTFDIPYLERRMNFYGLNGVLDQAHFDLYHFSRRAWGEQLPNCRLTTIEKEVAGVHRPVDIPSSMVPGFYTAYRDTGNPGPLVPIMQHNRQDILTLSKLFKNLHGEMLDG